MLIIVTTVFRQLIQKVLLGLGPRIGFELVKATKVVEGMASERMLFCYQNCSDLISSTVRKNCSSDREKLLKLEVEGRGFAKLLRSLEQFIQTVKGQNNFCNRMFFYLFLEVSHLMNDNNQNSI